ncbi:hypothetical protein ACHQM5_005364 [Ranunculus cassubicifolius]
MSNEESSLRPTPQPTQTQGTPLRRQIVDFNEFGKAMGPYAGKYSSLVGKMTRQHCPSIYSEWQQVPAEDKDEMWKGVVALYIVPDEHKVKQFRKANNLWKNWKTTLRRHMDKFETVQEQKRNSGVKREDWELCVDLETTEEARIRRAKGMASRMQLKNPHTTGRRGSARTAEILVSC